MERAVKLGDGNIFTGVHGSVEHPCNREASEIIAVIKIRHQNLQRSRCVAFGHRNSLDDGLEQRLQVYAASFYISRGSSGLGIGIQNRKVELLLLGIEIDEKVINLVQDFLRARIGPVDFVDHENGRKMSLKRLAEDIARLWQRTFTGVDQQHDTVNHLQCALYLSAKVAVAGCINNIDLHIVIENGRVLGQNGDAALALQIVRVHHPFDDVLVRAKRSTLLQHGVHERGLAMIHVGNNCDITNAGTQMRLPSQ